MNMISVGAFPSEKKYKGWTLGEKSFLMDFFEKNIKKDAKIVELGTGPGYLPYNLLQRGYRNISCTDLGNYIIFPEVKPLVQHTALNLNYDRLPFEDESVDMVVAVQTLEHVENIFHVSREVQRILKKDGWFVWSVPYGWSIQSRLKFLLTGDVIGWRRENSHICFLTRAIHEKCFGRAFATVGRTYLGGRIKLLGKLFNLPANATFGRAVCHFMKKKYNA